MGADLSGRVAIVTGGAQGIGRGIAQHLHSAGAHVLSLDLDEAASETLEGSGIVSATGNVGSAEDVASAVRLCMDRWGRIDIAVANAGVAAVEPLLSTSDEMWQRVIDTNLTGVFVTIREIAKEMASAGRGAIVATASTNAHWVENDLAAYNTSKGGVVALVRSAAIELAQHGIRVNAISPGLVRTRLTTFITDEPANADTYLEQIPLSRFGTPQDIGEAVAFLVSDEAGWITGVNLTIDGGQTLGTPVPSPDTPWLDE